MKEIKLGMKLRDTITGFVGTAVAKTEFINGCIQYELVPKVKRTGEKYPEAISIDQGSLEIVEVKQKQKVKNERPGGPPTSGIHMRGF